MKMRLQKLMVVKGLTSAKLAEAAGVRPSAVSHILSGRNYPSFDFIANILKAYPTLNPRWLLLGEGDIFEHLEKIYEISAEENDVKVEHIKDVIIPSKDEATEPPYAKFQKNEAINTLPETAAIQTQKKEIDQIVIFYSDGTFSLFKNN